MIECCVLAWGIRHSSPFRKVKQFLEKGGAVPENSWLQYGQVKLVRAQASKNLQIRQNTLAKRTARKKLDRIGIK